MRHWSRLATRNWRVKRLRTAGAILAIALGTGAVVWVTCCYESVRRTVLDWAAGYVGNAHVTISSPLGRYDLLPQRLERKVAVLTGVERTAPLLVQRLKAFVEPDQRRDAQDRPVPAWSWHGELDLHGIDLEREFAVRDWNSMLCAGRMLRADDEFVCVLERSIAEEQGIGVGDSIYVRGGLAEEPQALEVVGLIDRRRIARFLKGVALVRLPVLQQITQHFAMVNSIDLVLADPSRRGVAQAAARVRAILHREFPNAMVRSALARLKQVQKAQEQQEVVLVLLSCVAMLTALFIILSTLSMGMIERITQMGLLRCVGMTRMQLAWLTVCEVFPLGVVGVLLGIPVGLGLARLTVELVPEYVGAFALSPRGILLAVTAGLATSLVAALLPALAATRVSPLDATRLRAQRARLWPVGAVFALAAVLLAAQVYVIGVLVQRNTQFVQYSATSVVLLYLVYALSAPLFVWAVSRLAVPLVALVVGVRLRLLQDQVGRAVWRSAGICCGLMVGLSLIVGLVVFNSSFRSGWQFPQHFPQAFIWSFDQIDGDIDAAVTSVGGIKEYTVGNTVNIIVEERILGLDRIQLSMTWFVGVEPDNFFDLVHVDFIEGDQETACELLRKGGYVIIASDFARTRRKGVEEKLDEDGNVFISNKVRVWYGNQWHSFKVAGVIDSPALDIAASFFQVESEAHVVATGSVLGTNADMERLFKIHGKKLILLNYDLPPAEPPPGWTPPPSDAPAGRPTDDFYNKHLPLASRYQFYRETELLDELRAELGISQSKHGTARELKDEIDAELTKITYLLSAVPAVALLVAAIGVANLMTANVASRNKQIAIMRAVGATRGLILRLVVGEALVLGVLGSGLGLALGLHLAWNTTTMALRMWGFEVPFSVPWTFVGAAIAMTVGLCILAGIAPARHAARTNVIDALHVS